MLRWASLKTIHGQLSQQCAGASRDPPEKQAPMCTVHSFPHNIHHCLTFARSEFEGMFEKSPAEVNAFLSNPAKYLAAIQQASDAAARGQLELVHEVLVSDRCATFQDCVSWARKKFEVGPCIKNSSMSCTHFAFEW